jgi:haloacetate dehalogenase
MLLEGFARKKVDGAGVKIQVQTAGDGPPLLLLHGYPQTHVCWHKVAPELARRFTVVLPDLRGYGDSDKPFGADDHSTYSKRTMAADMVAVMRELGFPKFRLVGHDRGGRVAHRLMLDHPGIVDRWMTLDIAPTLATFERVDQAFAMASYHWFFLSQPYDLPEHLIALDPEYFLRTKLMRWNHVHGAITEEAAAEYLRCFRRPETIHASCEDYRAAASIDLVHDRLDAQKRVTAPLRVLWGADGRMGKLFDMLSLWRDRADNLSGRSLPTGHFLQEEAPRQVFDEITEFLGPA